jgi:protein SCO1
LIPARLVNVQQTLAGRAWPDKVNGMRLFSVLGAALLVAACQSTPPPREYHVVGQILAIDRPAARVTIRHKDIEGFMPGMTMPFPVKDQALLDGHSPGEMVDATLLVSGADVWIAAIEVTGSAPLPPATEIPAPGLAPGDTVPEAVFTDQNGAPLRLSDLAGHPAVVTFIYTRCPLPEFCPAVESRLLGLQADIRRDAALTGTRIVAITIDPEHDTLAVLKARAAERGSDPAIFVYATGTPEAIDGFGRQFGLAVTRTSSEPFGIEHNLRTVVLDSKRRIVQVLTGSDWRVSDLVGWVRKAAGPA